ncbi:MAG: DUF1624 domain-containing protein [Clostridia bacterium]|nr:DUF1624 domain-containing protein [Clostridia bacterium]
MAKARSGAAGRIAILDELRGLCILLMVLQHGLYTFGYIFHWPFAIEVYTWTLSIREYFAAAFVILCGISCHLSRSNLKRGLLLALVAAGLSFVLWLAAEWGLIGRNQQIWFGILHMLACCILFYACCGKLLKKIPFWLGLILTAALFFLTWYVPFYNGGFFGWPPFTLAYPNEWKSLPYLIPLGMGYIESGDFFPLIPWLFCFLFGACLGRYVRKLPKSLKKQHIRPLAFCGRHTLIIYLVHQPFFFGIGWLIAYFTGS